MSNALYPKAYGQWAVNPKGRKTDYKRCCAGVWSREGFGRHSQCSRLRGFGPDEAYCKQHDPAAQKARDEFGRKKFNEDMNKRRYGIYGRTFFDALLQIADGHNDARGLAAEVITEFKKGDYK